MDQLGIERLEASVDPEPTGGIDSVIVSLEEYDTQQMELQMLRRDNDVLQERIANVANSMTPKNEALHKRLCHREERIRMLKSVLPLGTRNGWNRSSAISPAKKNTWPPANTTAGGAVPAQVLSLATGRNQG